MTLSLPELAKPPRPDIDGLTRTQRGWPSDRHVLAALAVIIAVAAAIRVYLFNGFVGLDDAEYARFAHQMAHGSLDIRSYTGPAVFPLRVGVIAPTALLFRVFGMNEWTLVLYPLFLSLAGIALAYACATRLFGQLAGLMAAALVAIYPWDIDGATKLLPDLPAAFYAAAAITAILYLERQPTPRNARLFLGGIGAGLALGLSWLCKESVAYLAPLCAVWAITSIRHERRILSLWLGVAAGSLAVLLGEMIVYHAFTGDYLFRFHEVERNYRQWENSFFTEGSDFGWKRGESHAQALARRLFVTGPALILFSRTFFYLPLIGLGATLWAWRRGDRRFLIPSLWLWSLVLMFNFSSSSTATYTPLALFHRYLSPIFFPAIVLVSGFLATAITVDRRSRTRGRPAIAQWSALAIGLFVAWIGAHDLFVALRNDSTWLEEIRALRDRVNPATRIYSDGLSLRAFEFFNDFPRRTEWIDLRDVSSPDQIAEGSLVLVYPPGIEWLDRNAGMWVAWPAPGPTDRNGYLRQHFYRDPPASWTTVWQSGGVRLYRATTSPGRGARP